MEHGYQLHTLLMHNTAAGGSDQFVGQKGGWRNGLEYFGARYYNPSLMRWNSADSMTTHVYDPQSLNKYAYVRNNPVNLVDKNGMFLVNAGPGKKGRIRLTRPVATGLVARAGQVATAKWESHWRGRRSWK